MGEGGFESCLGPCPDFDDERDRASASSYGFSCSSVGDGDWF